jgi:hypothetical protein
VIGSFLALPSVALALLLAPEARVLTYRAIEVAVACEASCRGTVIAPEVCVAMAYVESRFRPERVSPAGALGILQVMPANLFVAGDHPGISHAAGPWALQTVAGGVEAGVRAAIALRTAHGASWLRWYACSKKAAKRGDRACVDHERKVRSTLARMKHRRES